METSNAGFWRRAGIYLGFIDSPALSVPRETRQGAAVEGALIPPPRPTGTALTVDTALSIGAVYRSISIIVSSVTQMELGVFRENKEIPPPSLIKQPNVNDTASGFIEETVFSLAAHGNAYWRLIRSSAGAPVQSIEVMDPATVTIREETNRDGSRRVRYYVGETELPKSRIKHLRLIRKPGQVKGLGPIQAATSELTFALRLREFVDQWFDINAVPTGVLTTDMMLGQDEAAEWAEAWRKFVKTHGVAVLGQGLKYDSLNLDPEQAQFLGVQNAVITGIARLFGVPANSLLAEVTGSAMTYQNLQDANIMYLQHTLSRYMNEIEGALTDLLPRGQRVQFKEEGLLRMNSQQKWEVLKIQSELGYTSGAELRAAEGKEPLIVPTNQQKPADKPTLTPVSDEGAA